MEVMLIPEQAMDGKRLGRHVEHDPRSKSYAWEETGATLTNVRHARKGSIFNQGEIGSCTGNAAAGAMNTDPIYSLRPKKGKEKEPFILAEHGALDIYQSATKLDNIAGAYPPDDTGSSGLAVAKVCANNKWISSYEHAFDLEAALDALMNGPIIVGVNWYEGFDAPDRNGEIKIAGDIRGGHEIVCREFVTGNTMMESLLWFDNSWGKTYGVGGRMSMTVRTFDELLAQQGDVTILIP